MNIILLSGGSGQRLWPLSNKIRSKQFIKIFRSELTSEPESMVQRVFRQIRTVDPKATITVATSKSQVSELHNQIGDVDLSIEPSRRDTFPAIALAAAYLHDVKHIDENEVVVVCPVDPLVEEDYFQSIKKLTDFCFCGDANLYVMGIHPTYPSEKYGYIIPSDDQELSDVSSFKEKPDSATAQRWIEGGALWNAGVFAFKLCYLLERAKALFGFNDYETILQKYGELEKISFDYAVVEKERSIKVLRFHGTWADVGTWNTFVGAMNNHFIGNVIAADDCRDCYVINELDLPLICAGIRDGIVVASPDGILVTTPQASSGIKQYVERLDDGVKYAEKSWGSYRVIDVSSGSMTVKVTLKSGHSMSYHKHLKRDESWTVTSGEGVAVIDGNEKRVGVGDHISLPAGSLHSIYAETDLTLIEIQSGEDLSVLDKVKLQEHFKPQFLSGVLAQNV